MNFAEKRLRPNRQDRQQVLRISIKMAAVLVLFSSGKAAISIDSLSFSTESSEKHGIYFAIRSDPAQILRLILMFLREGDGCASDVGIVPRDYSGVSHGLLLTDCLWPPCRYEDEIMVKNIAPVGAISIKESSFPIEES